MDKGYSNFNSYKKASSQEEIVVSKGKNACHIIEMKKENVYVSSDEKSKTKNRYPHHFFSDPKHSPLKIPKKAIIKKQRKKGYEQIKYVWSKGKYKYESRWHTKTANAPNSKQSWVVTRTTKGIGFGKNVTGKKVEVLVGKKWVSWSKWQEAIVARKNKTASKKQLEMLEKGHFTRKRGKKQ